MGTTANHNFTDKFCKCGNSHKISNRLLICKNHLNFIYILEMKYTSKMFLGLLILTYVCLETELFREDSTEFDFTLVRFITFLLIF
ncbi:hypothetical protein B1J93_10415 [Leptospira kirschneri serovar Pomona]|uniref:Uncharacterized protein n=1 Tax=Leptospira kirschneri serovar Pomona TaxID=561005 RepID=A0A1T1DN83_9LEPT|nr:hypothetical protein B1J93_10415 [Leptospira kirschneri serovar Pomona]